MTALARIAAALVTTAAVAGFAPGCGDASHAEEARDAQIAQLTKAVEDLSAANAELTQEVRRQGRQLAGMSRARNAQDDARAADAAESGTVPTAAAADGTGGVGSAEAAAAGAAADLAARDESVAATAVAALLQTETGRKAIQEAAAQEAARREQAERRLYVSYQVGVFARKAGLDDRQTEQLQDIWRKSMDDGVELRKQFAAIGALPEADREGARAKAMESMRDIGRERLRSVRDVLSGAQLEQYEKADEEIVAGLHGGPRR